MLMRQSPSKAERQIILLSASTFAHRRAMRERAASLVGELDWVRLAATLRWRKLLPTLGPRILELAEGTDVGDFQDAVDQAIDAARRQGAFLQLISHRLTTDLASSGIRSSPLKGPLFGEAIYDDPGRRLSSDIDLLVAPNELERAVEVVRELGYSAPTDYVEHYGLPLLHFALVHEHGELPPVELHWRIHWYEQRFAQERLLAPSGASQESWCPTLADEFTALLLFYARDGFIDLRLATDISAWWDVHGRGLTPGALDEVIRDYPALGRALPAAVEVAEKIVALPGAQIIRNRRSPDVRDRIAVRLANPNPDSSLAQLYADRGLIDGLLMPPMEFWAFMRRQVLPPREVLVERGRRAQRRRTRSTLGRGLGVLGRYALTTARLMSSPETTLH